MKHQIAYKVVRVAGDKRLSAVTNGVWQVEYTPGKFVRPRKGTKLLAFESRENAKCFAQNLLVPSGVQGFEIWKCEARGCRLVTYLPYAFDLNGFDKFWKELRYRKSSPGCGGYVHSLAERMFFDDAPPGTVACSALKLLEKVES